MSCRIRGRMEAHGDYRQRITFRVECVCSGTVVSRETILSQPRTFHVEQSYHNLACFTWNNLITSSHVSRGTICIYARRCFTWNHTPRVSYMFHVKQKLFLCLFLLVSRETFLYFFLKYLAKSIAIALFP